MGGRSVSPNSKKSSVMFSASDPGAWEEYSQTMAEGSIMGAKAAAKRTKKGRKGLDDESTLVMDPSMTAFERQDSIAYGPKAQTAKGLDVKDFPEVKECVHMLFYCSFLFLSFWFLFVDVSVSLLSYIHPSIATYLSGIL